MANTKIKKIGLPNENGNYDVYEVADWYGDCTTAANTQGKYAIVTGFYSASLVEGVRVVVRFTNGQTYNGTPTLDVNGTGAKNIQSVAGSSAKRYEWISGQIIAFVYYNGYWVIEDGGHATTTYWGKTKLTDTIANDSSVALTPKAVYDAGYATTSQIPTKVSDLNNDSGFLTLSTLPVWDGSVT